MSALAEKIKRLAMSTDFYNEVVEILLELEARQPNYTIQILPSPAAGPISPYTVPYPAPNPWYPNPSFPRVGDPPNWPLGGGGTLCYERTVDSSNNNSNGPMPQSDATGYVEPVGTLKLVGDGTPQNPAIAVYDRDVVKSLERRIEENSTNKFVVTKLEGLGPNATGSEFKVGYGG